jgi:ABC-type amino acid transport substrate-binding protein
MLKNLLLVVFLSCLAWTGCQAAEPGRLFDAVTAAKKITIGVSSFAPPFGVRRGGVYQGFDIDIAEAVFHGLGIDEIVYVPVTSEQRIPFLLAGRIDVVVANMTITRSRESQVDFSIPYFQDGISLLVAKDAPIKTYQDLAGRKVGVEAGTTAIGVLKQVAPGAEIVEFPSADAMKAGLESGAVPAISTDLLLLIGLRKACKVPADFRIAGTRFTTEPYGIALLPDQSKLRNAINHQLLGLWEDGTWQKIADTWFGPGAPFEHRLTFGITPYPK